MSGRLDRRSASTASAVVPSRLAGEGMKAPPQAVMGEGSFSFDFLHPSPLIANWKGRLALSRKGRGHHHARPIGSGGGEAA